MKGVNVFGRMVGGVMVIVGIIASTTLQPDEAMNWEAKGMIMMGLGLGFWAIALLGDISRKLSNIVKLLRAKTPDVVLDDDDVDTRIQK